MSPSTSRLLTGAATAVVAASAVYSAAIGEWGVAVACIACGFAVGVGWLIVRHDPTSPVGPALAWTTAAIALVTAHVGPLADLPWSSGIWPINLAGLLALLLVFPDGLLPGRLWRAVPIAYAVATVVMVIGQWGAKQIDGQVVGGPSGPWTMPLGIAALLTIAGCLLLGVAALVIRYRRGAARSRQQIRWLMLAGIAVVSLLVAGWVGEALGASLDVAYTPFLLAIVTLVPTAVGIAIVRYDLFDVDRLLSTTTAWLVTLVISAGIFGVVVYAVSHALSAWTDVSSAIAAFVTALVLIPLQRHVAAWVGRAVDRDRQVAVAEVERFAADVRAGRRQPEEIEDVLRQVQGDPNLVVQVVQSDGEWTRLDGTPVADPTGIALEAGGEAVARIHLGWDSARARRRMADLAKAAWVPIEVSRLRLGLREALAEAEASRHRLAEATSAERRRLERDLHDGVQQRIVATGMRLRSLQSNLGPDESAEVDVAVAELRETVEELRRLAHGVRPSQLDDGLAAALDTITKASPVPIEVDASDLPAVSDLRALTAYLVVSEAVTNALKHAAPSRIHVRIAPAGERLAVEVTDDGVGSVPPNAPLPALRDRVLSVGGSLEVVSSPGAGTTIAAVI